jgi:hypothetical protein
LKILFEHLFHPLALSAAADLLHVFVVHPAGPASQEPQKRKKKKIGNEEVFTSCYVYLSRNSFLFQRRAA